ncbi:MAG: thioredoxin family protein [Deltaproteobacteria bacterium]|nr:thioredoxin family protein [Deltaproteobacteria bacterium]
MSEDDVTQIKVGGSPVGIMGLKTIMEEMAPQYAEEGDPVVADELLGRLSRKNYIPPKVRDNYRKAFLREFKKFLGKPFEEEAPEGLELKVLGPGCVQCDQLEQQLMQVMAETGIVADVEHVRDVKEIGRYGVMGTPALIINGQVKSVGKVPPRNKLEEWLKEAQENGGARR